MRVFCSSLFESGFVSEFFVSDVFVCFFEFKKNPPKCNISENIFIVRNTPARTHAHTYKIGRLDTIVKVTLC